MNVRFVFHKPAGERWVGKVIVAWTWALGLFYNWGVLKYNYSHEEVWLPNEFGGFCKVNGLYIDRAVNVANIEDVKYVGQCFSATTRGAADGVRILPARKVLGKHPGRWDFIECEVSPILLETAIEKAKKLVGKKYDYLGLFGYFQPLVIEDRKKWYCSEICDWFKWVAGLYPKRNKRISPRRAAYLLAKTWGEPRPVKRRSQNTEVRSQKPENRSQNPEVRRKRG